MVWQSDSGLYEKEHSVKIAIIFWFLQAVSALSPGKNGCQDITPLTCNNFTFNNGLSFTLCCRPDRQHTTSGLTNLALHMPCLTGRRRGSNLQNKKMMASLSLCAAGQKDNTLPRGFKPCTIHAKLDGPSSRKQSKNKNMGLLRTNRNHFLNCRPRRRHHCRRRLEKSNSGLTKVGAPAEARAASWRTRDNHELQ